MVSYIHLAMPVEITAQNGQIVGVSANISIKKRANEFLCNTAKSHNIVVHVSGFSSAEIRFFFAVTAVGQRR